MRLLYCILFCLCAGCTQTPELPHKKIVLTTVAPYQYFVEKIAGDTVQIEVLVPAGASPHAFEPTPRLVGEMGRASLWLKSGELFEERMGRVLGQSTLAILDLCEGIPLLNESDGGEGADLHIWMSPKLAQLQAKKIAEALIALNPEYKELYRERLELLVIELEKLDVEIATMLEPMRGGALLTSHAAFGYFCRDYGLKQLALETEGKEPRPQELVHLIAEAKECGVQSAFVQQQYSNKAAEEIADELHIPVYTLDPYASDYPSTLRHLAHLLCQPSP